MQWKEKNKTYNDVKLGIDIDDFSRLIDDWQGRDTSLVKCMQRIDQRCVHCGGGDVVERAQTQVTDRLVQVVGQGQVVVVEEQELQDPLMSQDVQHIPRLWVNDWQSVHLFLDQSFDGIEQTGIRIDGAEGLLIPLKYICKHERGKRQNGKIMLVNL